VIGEINVYPGSTSDTVRSSFRALKGPATTTARDSCSVPTIWLKSVIALRLRSAFVCRVLYEQDLGNKAAETVATMNAYIRKIGWQPAR
jgi:hypothetical protein